MSVAVEVVDVSTQSHFTPLVVREVRLREKNSEIYAKSHACKDPCFSVHEVTRISNKCQGHDKEP